MPALSYTSSNFPFQKYATIYSADLNTSFTDIKTLLNTTGLDDTNLQNAGITRATKLKVGTASYVLINDGTGAMSEEAQLATTRGGTGQSLSPGSANTDDVIKVAAGVFSVGATPIPAPVKVYTYFRFT